MPIYVIVLKQRNILVLENAFQRQKHTKKPINRYATITKIFENTQSSKNVIGLSGINCQKSLKFGKQKLPNPKNRSARCYADDDPMVESNG